MASENGHTEVVKYLASKRADSEINSHIKSQQTYVFRPDTNQHLAGHSIIATRSGIIDDSIAQHALYNQRPAMSREPLVNQGGVSGGSLR
ncbi:hypothetical protein BB559_006975 [Furculomyces boomerangus]|uniref:Uncharacterized protein n=1 Tax=Furculomyces boomerangus TaxID=61424 RepID=A0A2T9XZI2_9FUNG|nr:hypothetical protein BB559_006975 [Furculomyces boomerangus]